MFADSIFRFPIVIHIADYDGITIRWTFFVSETLLYLKGKKLSDPATLKGLVAAVRAVCGNGGPLENPGPKVRTNAVSSVGVEYCIRYWVIHAVTLPSIFLAGYLFVSTGLAYDTFGTPRPDAYFQASESKAPVVSQRYEAKSQLDLRLQ